MSLVPAPSLSFATPTSLFIYFSQHGFCCQYLRPQKHSCTRLFSNNEVQLEASLGDGSRVKELFAWISLAILGDIRYQDLDLGIDAVFGTLPKDSPPKQLLSHAFDTIPSRNENVPYGLAFSQEEQHHNSLGPLGAGQWSVQCPPEIFPHSLLKVGEISSVDDWTRSLPRTCRQNIRKAQKAAFEDHSFSVHMKEILPDAPAPHSTLAHFRCVVEHVIRLTTARYNSTSKVCGDDTGANDNFFNGICEAIERYIISTQGSGTIMEYQDREGCVIAFCHIVGKGKTLRGQWFYSSNQARNEGHYIWFHSIWEMVRRAVGELHDVVTVVDLGPSGTDGCFEAHAKLKKKYGFELYEDWPSVADYRGEFWSIQNS